MTSQATLHHSFRQRIVANLAFAFTGRTAHLSSAAAGVASPGRAGLQTRFKSLGEAVSETCSAADAGRAFAPYAIVLYEHGVGRATAEATEQGSGNQQKKDSEHHGRLRIGCYFLGSVVRKRDGEDNLLSDNSDWSGVPLVDLANREPLASQVHIQTRVMEVAPVCHFFSDTRRSRDSAKRQGATIIAAKNSPMQRKLGVRCFSTAFVFLYIGPGKKTCEH
jgi:hypothetical protein